MQLQLTEDHHGEGEYPDWPVGARVDALVPSATFPGWWQGEVEGRSAYFPQALLDDGRLAANYNPTELALPKGSRVHLLGVLQGWAFVAHRGRQGWLPLGKLQGVALPPFTTQRAPLFPDLHGGDIHLTALVHDDAAGLREAVMDGELWTLTYAGAPEADAVEAYIDAALADNARHAYTVRDGAGRVLGTTSFYRVEADIRRLLIGYTWYRQSVWRSAVNTTCKLLLLQHAFEDWGANVVAWETDNLNTRSQAAIERLGARRDGILRGHRLRRDGTVRDTVAYSMTRAEWPAAKAVLQGKLGDRA
ncbi:MAG: GNAT family N-acetyltransferase [Cardiobacteriaceae bacterium]|nr:GNAT family N-acetyltransferase [Cardiobacteriaceae bacterium]